MKYKVLLASLLALSISSAAQSSLLTFEDVPGGSIPDAGAIILTYKGFYFKATLAWVDVGYGSHLWPYGAHGGDFAAVNNHGGAGIITEENGADFSFDGLWAKKWATAPESGGTDSLFGSIYGYNNGSLIWTVATSLNGSYKYYGAQGGAIDELRLDFGDFFLVDNIRLNNISPIPIPAAAFMFAPALLGFMGLRRRAKNKAV